MIPYMESHNWVNTKNLTSYVFPNGCTGLKGCKCFAITQVLKPQCVKVKMKLKLPKKVFFSQTLFDTIIELFTGIA